MKNKHHDKRPGRPSETGTTSGRSWYLSGVYPLCWFAIGAFLLFGQTIRYDYTYLDDQTLVLEQLQNFQSPKAFIRAWQEDAFHAGAGRGYYYRPVLTLSFMLDSVVGKGNFAVSHVANIVYHILATWLVFLFFIHIGINRRNSFLAALLFSVHPLVTQAVAWVPGRNDSLLTLFTLGSMLFWIRYLEKGRTGNLLLHLIFMVLAFLTKENALVIPFLAFLYSILLKKVPAGRYTVPVLAWFFLAVGYMLLRSVVLYGPGKVPLSEQLMTIPRNLPAIVPFLGKALFPFDLSVFPALADMKVSIMLGLVAMVILTAMLLMTRPKNWGIWLFSMAWFLAFLLPALIKINKQIPDFAEHRMYLPLVGLMLLLLFCYPISKTDFRRHTTLIPYILIVLLFSTLTYLHSRNFRNRLVFWQCAVETSPSNAFNHNNLGAMYYLDGTRQKAEQYFRKALEINPNEPMANSNIGLILMDNKQPAEAETCFLREIEINPTYTHAYYNLGLLYAQYARYDEAVTWWEKTLNINPKYPDAYRMLVVTYRNMNRPADAARIREQALVNGIDIP